MTTKVFKPSGVKVDILSTHDDGEYFMCRSNTTGKVFFAHKDQVYDFMEANTPTPKSNTLKTRRGRRAVQVEETRTTPTPPAAPPPGARGAQRRDKPRG